MKVNRFYTLILICAIAVGALQAQERHGKFDVRVMHANKWTFLMNEVHLSPAEEAAVKPYFLEFENKNWDLHKLGRENFRRPHNKQLSEKDYKELNDKMINMEIKRTQYMREYHIQLRRLLKPETLFQYYWAQKKFEQQLFQRGPKGPGKDNKPD